MREIKIIGADWDDCYLQEPGMDQRGIRKDGGIE